MILRKKICGNINQILNSQWGFTIEKLAYLIFIMVVMLDSTQQDSTQQDSTQQDSTQQDSTQQDSTLHRIKSNRSNATLHGISHSLAWKKIWDSWLLIGVYKVKVSNIQINNLSGKYFSLQWFNIREAGSLHIGLYLVM